MYVHSRYESINVDAITHISWNHIIENTPTGATVVCLSLVNKSTLYLHYNDPDDMKVILKLKEVLDYPYELPKNTLQ
ncbi:hypothetical protein NIES267_75680 (plasmid) [Calothrix parasitica NIES-267]|uniref:Uncharacterized protein n=1 Tax=Calothrix parasitica NIES-267 TaxID=1973488 RepID=A0A1Z4M3I2_9CYAN|nr:hypothetical protein NIES267_75680 [Calothrix parasitica NIES-267]